LIGAILQARGFKDITVFDPAAGAVLLDNAFDFAVETLPTPETMGALMRAVRPRGKIVLKSRRPEPIGISFAEAIRKELTFAAVNYGSFPEALELLASGALPLGELLGDVHPLEDFAEVFAASKTHETRKTFFSLVEQDVWDR
jgi:threonine dehydrogenase-like Zn-dependent dehydrogenase